MMLSDQNSFFSSPQENHHGPVDPSKLKKQLHALQYLPSGPDPIDFSHYDGGSPPYSDDERSPRKQAKAASQSPQGQNSDHQYFEIEMVKDRRVSEDT